MYGAPKRAKSFMTMKAKKRRLVLESGVKELVWSSIFKSLIKLTTVLKSESEFRCIEVP